MVVMLVMESRHDKQALQATAATGAASKYCWQNDQARAVMHPDGLIHNAA
jgi:hypothetical protein